MCAAFTPDGKRAVSGGADGIARLWDVDTGKELRQFHGHTATILTIAFSADGRRFLTGSHDASMRLWDVDSGANRVVRRPCEQCPVRRLLAGWPTGRVRQSRQHCAALGPGERHPAPATPGRRPQSGGFGVIAGRPAGGRIGFRQKHPGVGPEHGPAGAALAGAHECGQHGGLFPRRTLPGVGQHGPNGAAVGRGCRRRGPLLRRPCRWHSGRGFHAGRLRILSGGGAVWDKGQWSRGTDFDVRVWGLPHSLPAPSGTRSRASRGGTPPGRARARDSQRPGVAGWPAVGLRLHGRDRALWDFATGQEIGRLVGHRGHAAWALAWSPDSRHVLTGGEDGSVRLWDAATGQERVRCTGHQGLVWSVALAAGRSAGPLGWFRQDGTAVGPE